MPPSLPDLATIDSQEKADALLQRGLLEKLFLMPPEFGGQDIPANVLYAPPSAVRRKQEIDQGVIVGLAEAGKISQYSAKCEYQGASKIPTAVTIDVSEPETYRFVISIWGDALARDEKAWDAVYAAREALYAQHLGKLEGDVQKLINMMGIWPGGCLVQLESPRHGVWVTSSFGLTNPDMPATTTLESFEVQGEGTGDLKHQMQIASRPPRPIPVGIAGYGYEMLVFTRGKETWPLNFLDWAVQMEITRDVDFLKRMEKYGAVTIEDVSLGEHGAGDFIIAPLRQFAPHKMELPNGTMELLVATRITRAEMQLGAGGKGRELLERIVKRPGGQVSL